MAITLVKQPDWSWGQHYIKYRGKRLNWFSSYVMKRTADRDARLLQSHGHTVVLAYGGLRNGWAIYTDIGFSKPWMARHWRGQTQTAWDKWLTQTRREKPWREYGVGPLGR